MSFLKKLSILFVCLYIGRPSFSMHKIMNKIKFSTITKKTLLAKTKDKFIKIIGGKSPFNKIPKISFATMRLKSTNWKNYALLGGLAGYGLWQRNENRALNKTINDYESTTRQPSEEVDFLDMLYNDSPRLYISPEEIFDVQGKPINLEVLFEKYHIISSPYCEKYWEYVTNVFVERARHKDKKNFLTLTDLQEWLRTAKSTLKSFLLKNDNELSMIEQNYIRKASLRRLFTYAKIQSVIEKNTLSNVRLPRKVLVIKNKRTGKYVSSEDAPKIIDEILQIHIDIDRLAIFYSDEYELIIFAHKEKNHSINRRLSQKAQKDLKLICKKAPFDVGYDNIFTDSNGDAVIIDTEHKGEYFEDCLAKLNRYRFL